MTEADQFVPCLEKAALEELPRYGDDFQHEWEYASDQGRDPALVAASNRTLETRMYSTCRTVLRLALKNRRLRAQTLRILEARGPKAEHLYAMVKQVLDARVEYHDTRGIEEGALASVLGRWAGGRLHLPKRNLVTGRPSNYVARLADELERFPHLRAYLLDEQTIVDHIVHDVSSTEILLSETQWGTYAPTPPLLLSSPHYSLNTYDTIVRKGGVVAFSVERVGRTVL